MAATRLRSDAWAGQQGFEVRTAGGPGGLDGNPRPVVCDAHAAVGREGDVDGACVAGEDLVHRPVGDLEHELTQAAFAGRADIHPGPLPNGFASLQHLNMAGVVPHGVLTHELPLGVSGRRRQPRRIPGKHQVRAGSPGAWVGG
ncbi:hypothetical protein GCM10010271_08550 [Streptomyces kurssanovii]|nr:hypothetical protein GCM10010271_08550 [Streptomyces kurssanovii]